MGRGAVLDIGSVEAPASFDGASGTAIIPSGETTSTIVSRTHVPAAVHVSPAGQAGLHAGTQAPRTQTNPARHAGSQVDEAGAVHAVAVSTIKAARSVFTV